MNRIPECSGIPNKGRASEVRIDTPSGYGSTNSNVRTFSVLRFQYGGDIRYVPSSVLGDSIVVMTSGVYAVTYIEQSNGTASTTSVTVNETPATLGSGSLLTYAQGYRGKGTCTTSSNSVCSVSLVLWLDAGSVLRVHGDGNINDNEGTDFFSVLKVT